MKQLITSIILLAISHNCYSATITTSIGTRSAENVDITNVTGGGPYTVTLSGTTSSTDNGDTLTDEAAAPRLYLITAGAGTASLTVTDSFGAGAAPDFSGTTQATTTRTYSSITNWESNLDDTNMYSSADDAVGEGYNDSVFNEELTVNGGATVGLTSVTLTVPEGERHDGTAGTGTRLVSDNSATGDVILMDSPSSGPNQTISWWELSQSTASNAMNNILRLNARNNTVFGRNLIVHTATNSRTGNNALVTTGIGTTSGEINLMNSILYNRQNTRASTAQCLGFDDAADATAGTLRVQNITVADIDITDASNDGNATGISITGSANPEVSQNNIAMDVDSAGAGTAADFAGSPLTESYNMSEDATAAGTGSLTSKTYTSQFVSTSVGSENLHLKSGADAIDAGTDLGTSPTGVNIDIDNRDRDAEGDTWDMGADELVSEGAAVTHQQVMFI